MNYILLTLWLALGCKTIKTRPDEDVVKKNQQEMKSIYDIKVVTIEGEETTLAQYKGKKMLIINVASECGYTPQYTELQGLYDQHGDKVVLLGFPANNFGGQEPGSDAEIKSFCQKNFGVTFPMFSKISVKGKDMHELYQWLSTKEQNGWNDKTPTWNFCKYLVSEDGKLLKFYSSSVSPLSDEIVGQL